MHKQHILSQILFFTGPTNNFILILNQVKISESQPQPVQVNIVHNLPTNLVNNLPTNLVNSLPTNLANNLPTNLVNNERDSFKPFSQLTKRLLETGSIIFLILVPLTYPYPSPPPSSFYIKKRIIFKVDIISFSYIQLCAVKKKHSLHQYKLYSVQQHTYCTNLQFYIPYIGWYIFIKYVPTYIVQYTYIA